MKIAIYPGSFDPPTLGHMDMITRSSKLCDELIVAILRNTAKNPLFSVDERVRMMEEMTKEIPNVRIDSFEGLTADYAESVGAQFLIRGLRAVTDFEYELQIAQTNHVVNPNLDTIFLTTKLEYAYLSSTIVKEVASFHGDISKFVTPAIENHVIYKFKQ